MPPETVVIVGAGLAGANVAVTLRAEGFRGRVILLGSEREIPYGRPPLSKTYLRGEEQLDGWRVKPAAWYERNDVEFRAGTQVASVDADAREIKTDHGETLGYDSLVLCGGGRPRRPELPGIGLQGVHILRTVADCDAIKNAARPGTRAVVVGMGFIGSEVAASLSQLGVSVSAVFGGAAPLEAVLGTEVGGVMARIHRDHGVGLLPDDRVVRFEGADVLQRVVTRAGARIDCDFAVVGMGIEPNVEPAAKAGIALENGVVVDPQCRTNIAGVYAAGDIANHMHPLFGRIRVEHYNNAEKMGAAAARSVLGDDRPYDYVHTFWSDQFDDKLEYVGHATGWDRFVARGSLEERRFLGFYLKDRLLTAAMGLNRGGDPELDPESDLRVCQELIAARVSPSPEALADEQTDLRAWLAE